jgi:ankyrin repeat protein
MKAKRIFAFAFAGSNSIVLVCLIILQFFSTGRAQTRLDYQTVENFFVAIADNDTNTASQLLESNTNLVFARDNGSKLPFLEAAAAGNVSLIKRMLELGADINAAGDTFSSVGMQDTALHWAVERNHFDVCQYLLEAGANPNRMNANFSSPLHLAFNENRGNMANLLLDYGADPFLEKLFTNDKTTPFELAVTRSDGKLVQRMLGQDQSNPLGKKSLTKSMPPNRPRQPAKTAADILTGRSAVLLAAATQRGELEAVQALLVAGVSAKTNVEGDLPLLQVYALSAAEAAKARPSAIAQWQQTSNTLKHFGTNANPQFLASIRSQEADQAARVQNLAPERWLQIRDLLIKNGAAYDAFAATALGDTNQARRLLVAGKNVVQSRDRDGGTPLHWAVQSDQLPLTSFWLEAGVPPAATNFAGQTALHIAAGKNLVEHMKLLLAANAPTDTRDTNGWTPLDTAEHSQNTEAIRLLLSVKSVPQPAGRAIAISIHEAAASGNLSALAALAEATNNLEARNELGLTPLQVAVLNGHFAAAALLVDNGANVNVRDPDGNTLLLQILLQERDFFVRDRPPTNWLDRMGQDPRKDTYAKYLTVGQNEQGPNPVLQAASFLLACGVNAKATNHAGQTAIQLVTDEKTSRSIFFFDDDQTVLLKLLGGAGGSFDAADADGNTPLHRLVHGFFSIEAQDSISGLIAAGANVNATNNQGRTPLHMTIQPDYIWTDWMKMLLAAHADVNAQDTNGFTPLHLLALSKADYDQGEAAGLLIQAGAKPDILDDQGRTPLMLMAGSDAFPWEIKSLVQALLDARANPNIQDKQGRTALHLFLLQHPDSECIPMIAKAGADLSAKDNEGKTPLHYLAAYGGPCDIFATGKVDLNARDNDADTPSHIAAKSGRGDVFNWLAQHGADLNATNKAGETPRLLAAHKPTISPYGRSNFGDQADIFEAVRNGSMEAVANLLKADPELVNSKNQYNETPLRVTVKFDGFNTNMVEFLVAHGAKWDAYCAAMAGRADVIRTLLAQEPNSITNRYDFGTTLLNIAASHDHLAVAEVLLSAGADVTARNWAGISPLGSALAGQYTDMAGLLRAHGATENIFDATVLGHLDEAKMLIAVNKSQALATNEARISLTALAIASGHGEILKLLLDNGAPLVSPNATELLNLAAVYNQSNAVPLVIRHGAKVNAFDKNGLTALHLAAFYGSTEVAALLLKNNANPDVPATPPSNQPAQQPAQAAMMRRRSPDILAGDTALHLAALASQTNTVELLLKSGTSVNATNAMRMTPLDLTGQGVWLPNLSWIQQEYSLSEIPGLPKAILSKPWSRPSPAMQQLTIALLEKAGGKHGEQPGPAGMMPFGPPTMTRLPSVNVAPDSQAPVLQTGADYHTQGCVDYNSRRFTNALADFRKSYELGSDNQDYSYFRIWLIRARLGETEAATRELASYLERRKALKPDDWPSKVGRYLAGQLSESDFLKAADDPNLQTAKEQHCEAYFYTGSKHLIENDRMAAVDCFKKCLTTNVTDFEEYTSAATELLFLQMPSINSK